MRLMPPSRISATRAARDRPMTQWITVMPLSFIVKKAVMAFVMEPVMAFTWLMLPMPKHAMPARAAYTIASHFHFGPMPAM